MAKEAKAGGEAARGSYDFDLADDEEEAEVASPAPAPKSKVGGALTGLEAATAASRPAMTSVVLADRYCPVADQGISFPACL